MKTSIDQLIINTPYAEPAEHWLYDRESKRFTREKGRRASGYWRASQTRNRRNTEDPGVFVPIPLVNEIRPRVQQWRENGYPNVTDATKRLLEFWTAKQERQDRLFWCQLEAIETAIWLAEADPGEKQGIHIPPDGGEWQRQCLKLATGTGKTVVMAMLVAWQALNKIAAPQDERFSNHILIVAPGLTVRDRLQVLLPSNPENFYQAFRLVDSEMWQDLRRAKIEIKNWHTLAPYDENSGPKVVKKGEESNEAFFRRVLKDFGDAENILVLNDEAHHCHRGGGKKDEQATVWVGGLDRIHRARGVLRAYDLSATPFIPTGRNNQGEQLFDWIVSDFGLNDAIESGLVKTPKVAVRDDMAMDGKLRSLFFHIYEHVKDDLNRRAEKTEGLPDLVRRAVEILSADWNKEKTDWDETAKETGGRGMLPVMIMICNRTETAARLEYSLEQGKFIVDELTKEGGLLRIDQDALDKLDAGKETGAKKDAVKAEREKFNTVGKEDKPGENVRCVIGVNMLSEGWDARTVTHILGLRAFTSQLLCEQVVGRGLRRISYETNDEKMYEPEYVTVFGVPFTFLPVEGGEDGAKKDRRNILKTKIEPLKERSELKIEWPHIMRIDYRMDFFLELDWDKLEKLVLSPSDAPTVVEVAPVIDGRPKFDAISEMDLDALAKEEREQQIKIKMAVYLHEHFGKNWEGDPGSHIGQLARIIGRFFESDKLEVRVPLFGGAEKLRRILLALNQQKMANHIGGFIRSNNNSEPHIIFDPVRPKRGTASMQPWHTGRRTNPTVKSHINHIVADSGWEAQVAAELDRDRIENLLSWAKNERLGFMIYYLWQGQIHVYYPDFIIKFTGNRHLILEVKGRKWDEEKEKAKQAAAREWAAAVTQHGKFGNWQFKVLENMTDIFEVVRFDEE